MAASTKVYVCGRCGDYGAPNLQDLVAHMSNCGGAETKEKDDTSQYEDNEVLYDDSENSEDQIEYFDISEDKDSSQKSNFSDGILTSSQSGHRSHIIDVDDTSPTPFLWSRKTGLILLNLLKSHKEDLESPYVRRKTLFQKIALEMQQKYGYSVTAAQCSNKFKNMSNRYRKAREYNQLPNIKTKHTCFLYNELHEYFTSDSGYHPRRNPVRYETRIQTPKEVTPSNYIDSDTDNAKSISVSKDKPIITSVSTLVNVSEDKLLNVSEDKSKNASEDKPINVSESENSSVENCVESETEPMWVKRMMETFERCHRENVKIQREFIDILNKILEKK